MAYHNNKYGCHRCTVVGYKSLVSGSTVFPNFECELRTDEKFRLKEYGLHHQFDSPLLDLPFDLVRGFPIADRLHLLELGNTKQLIGLWKGGIGHEWDNLDIYRISLYMRTINKPAEIHRKIRGLDEMSHYKGTEYRTFLLYLSIVILKKYLPEKYYNHYLLYFCAVTICSSEIYLKDLTDTADDCLKHFLKNFLVLYGKPYVFMNVHNLCHLMDDVKKFGSLEQFSTYPFESMLYQLKLMVRTGNNPLSQIANRMIERESSFEYNKQDKSSVLLKKETQFQLPELDTVFIDKDYVLCEEIMFHDYLLNNKDENKWILLKNDKIIALKYVVYVKKKFAYIYGNELNEKFDYFEKPFQSRFLNIYQSDGTLGSLGLYNIDDIRCKLFILHVPQNEPIYDKEKIFYERPFVFLPIIHTLKN